MPPKNIVTKEQIIQAAADIAGESGADAVTARSVAAKLGISLAASWFIKGGEALPVKNDLFVLNMVCRVICIVLGLSLIVIFVYLVGRFLVNAKKDEMERNNERVQTVLSTVREISEQFISAGSALSDISANEAASAEQLSSMSSELLSNSNVLLEKARTGVENLNELKDSGMQLSENVRKVGDNSDEVMKKSSANEELLNSLRSVNKESLPRWRRQTALR